MPMMTSFSPIYPPSNSPQFQKTPQPSTSQVRFGSNPLDRVSSARIAPPTVPKSPPRQVKSKANINPMDMINTNDVSPVGSFRPVLFTLSTI